MEIGLIGCGRWGRHILRDLVELGARVTVLARSEATATRAREGAAQIATRWEEMPEVDGFVVATPTASHAESVAQLAERGVPVFVEKPLTSDPVTARQLVSLMGSRLFVMDKWRYHPGVLALASLASDGSLGRVTGLETIRFGWGNPHADADPVWILAPHDLAIGLEILGRIPAGRVAVGELDRSGELLGLRAILGEQPWWSLQVSCRHREHWREVRLHGEDGLAVLAHGYAEEVQIYRNPDSFSRQKDPDERIPLASDLPLRRELQAFLDHLGGGPPPKSSAQEGLRIVESLAELRRLATLGAEAR